MVRKAEYNIENRILHHKLTHIKCAVDDHRCKTIDLNDFRGKPVMNKADKEKQVNGTND